jgi:hypothetical protein
MMSRRSAADMTEAEDDTSVPIRREIAQLSGALINGGHTVRHTPLPPTALGHIHLSKHFWLGHTGL